MNLKVIIEEHADGFVAYPIGLKGVVVAEGDTFEEALDNVQSAARFHIETFGADVFENEDAVIHIHLAETAIAV